MRVTADMELFTDIYDEYERDEDIETITLEVVSQLVADQHDSGRPTKKHEGLEQKYRELTDIERSYRKQGYMTIAGIDEAGRGPLAGPVVSAAVVLKGSYYHEYASELPGLDDSKKLTERRRIQLFDQIVQASDAIGLGIATSLEIDKLNILKATHLAMNRAISSLSLQPDLCLIDGNSDPKVSISSECLIKGDSRVSCISAASIVAKVARDLIMQRIHEKYPAYGFAKHKGYPTRDHYSALSEYGPCPVHRISFRLE